VLDELGNPVEGATVTGDWTGAVTQLNQQRVTDASGVAYMSCGFTKNGGTFIITITDVTASGYVYNPALNVETTDQITAP
jgi:hypothetical protein